MTLLEFRIGIFCHGKNDKKNKNWKKLTSNSCKHSQDVYSATKNPIGSFVLHHA